MFGRTLMPVLLGATLGLAAPHPASAQNMNDVVNGLAGRVLGGQPQQNGANNRDAYEQGRADAMRDQRQRNDDDGRRRGDYQRRQGIDNGRNDDRREDERRRADADRQRHYADEQRHQADVAQQQADAARARADQAARPRYGR